MRRALLTLVLTSVLALGMSCGGEEPPPDGYHLNLRFVALTPSVLDDLTISFEPGSSPEERFMDIEPMSFEDGAISLTVAPDGVLVMTISGSHIAANVTDPGDGTFLYDLELWSMDERSRMPAPAVRVVGNRGGEAIAEGFQFLPAWPLPVGQSSTVQVECRMAVSDRCIP